MARLARYVAPGFPHHVTQRGNGRQQTFFSVADYAAYRDLLAQHCAMHGVAVWSWVLMPNHVHLILVSAFLDRVSNLFGRNPKPGKRGPKRRQEGELSALSP